MLEIELDHNAFSSLRKNTIQLLILPFGIYRLNS